MFGLGTERGHAAGGGSRLIRVVTVAAAAVLAATLAAGSALGSSGPRGNGERADGTPPPSFGAGISSHNPATPPDHAGPPESPGKGKGKPGGGDDPSEWPVQPSALVRQPTVTGPVEGGIRTGQPYGTTMLDMPEGWVEEEFFIEGTARAPEELSDPDAPGVAYKTRIMIRRPTDPTEFNGTVVLDWNNVTIPADRDVAWQPLHLTLFERGYVYVSVAAQRLGVEFSPLALKQWDPVRYGSLNHPGDDYSWDIFSQAAEAVLGEAAWEGSDPRRVLGELRPGVEYRLAMGASQSGSRLRSYINTVHAQALVFDGFQPQISSQSGVDRTLAPILWVNSGNEADDEDDTPPDSDLFRLWEIAGTAHTSNGSTSYNNSQIAYGHSNGAAGDTYDYEEGGSWGYFAQPGECLRSNFYVAGYAWSAALVALDDWVRTGVAPSGHRLARDENGRRYDGLGNMLGGVRSPIVDVPIGTYFGGDVPDGSLDPCANVGGRMALSGWTRVFSAEKLDALYPTADDYLTRFAAAVDEALAAGFLLPEGADDMLRRAHDAVAILDAGNAVATIPGG